MSPLRYTIRAGDTLSQLAERFYGNWRAFPMLWEANARRLRGRCASEIFVGEVIELPGLYIEPGEVAAS